MITILFNGQGIGQLTFRINPTEYYSVKLDRIGLKTANIGTEHSLTNALSKVAEYVEKELSKQQWNLIAQQIEQLVLERNERFFEIDSIPEPKIVKHA